MPAERITATTHIAHARRLAERADQDAARWLDGDTSIDLDEVDALASDAIELLKSFRDAFADDVLATRILADLPPADLTRGATP